MNAATTPGTVPLQEAAVRCRCPPLIGVEPHVVALRSDRKIAPRSSDTSSMSSHVVETETRRPLHRVSDVAHVSMLAFTTNPANGTRELFRSRRRANGWTTAELDRSVSCAAGVGKQREAPRRQAAGIHGSIDGNSIPRTCLYRNKMAENA